MKKPLIHVEMPVWADAKDLLTKMDEKLTSDKLFTNDQWLEQCAEWKQKYPVVQPKHFQQTTPTNVYAFIKTLSSKLKEGQVTVVGNGSACVVGSHGYVIKKNQRFIINSAIASMGYDLPAAIGAYVADHKQDVINVTGDGSIQMNIQELETISYHKMGIKIFVINNNGYHSIRQTQRNFFGEPLVGIGGDSHDIGFPKLAKISAAYDIPYYAIENNQGLDTTIDKVLDVQGPVICEVFVDTVQNFEPKSATKRLEDGTLVSAPLEDLAPFLPKEEFLSNMIVKPVKE